jgi:hypothetical protein
MNEEEINGLALEDPKPEPEEVEGLTLEEPKPESEEGKPKEFSGHDDVPDAYEVEGESPAFNEGVGKVAREIGLSQDHLERVTQAIDDVRQNEAYAVAKQWVEQLKQDPEIGGQNFDSSLKLARQVFDEFAPSTELRQLLAYSGVTNHPDFIRMFTNIAKRLGMQTATASRFPNSRMED